MHTARNWGTIHTEQLLLFAVCQAGFVATDGGCQQEESKLCNSMNSFWQNFLLVLCPLSSPSTLSVSSDVSSKLPQNLHDTDLGLPPAFPTSVFVRCHSFLYLPDGGNYTDKLKSMKVKPAPSTPMRHTQCADA